MTGSLNLNDCIAELVAGYKASLEDDGEFVASEFADQYGCKAEYDEENDSLILSGNIPKEISDMFDDSRVVACDDGGAFSFDEEDGTIRYIDEFGNSEGLWRVGEEQYEHYKTLYFPNCKVKSSETTILIVNIPYPNSSDVEKSWEEKLTEIVGSPPVNYNNLGDNTDFHFEVLSDDVQDLMDEISNLDFVLGVFEDESIDDEIDEIQRRDEKNGLYPQHEDIAN